MCHSRRLGCGGGTLRRSAPLVWPAAAGTSPPPVARRPPAAPRPPPRPLTRPRRSAELEALERRR
eukprot:1492773-Prymnesium_polylepis.1